jgi:orotidine-5'-phosphate decarboxylase
VCVTVFDRYAGHPPVHRRKGDQHRTTGAAEAIARGSDFVVVGRPIRDADDPVEAAEAIVDEIGEGIKRARRPRR